MKVLFFIFAVLLCIHVARAQEQDKGIQPEKFDKKAPGKPSDPTAPPSQFRLPKPETPSFRNSPNQQPRYLVRPDSTFSDATVQFNMPIVKPGPEFFSNMPIMIPDSSVHYHILQVKPGKGNGSPETNK